MPFRRGEGAHGAGCLRPRCASLFALFLLASTTLASTTLASTTLAPAQDRNEQDPEPAPELVTDRPDVTESTSIVPSGWMQLETGGSVSGEATGAETFSGPGTLVRIGLFSRVEGRLAWDGAQKIDAQDPPGADDVDEDVSGAGDGEAALKISILEQAGARPAFALLPGVTLPIGEKPFGSGAIDPGIKALLSNNLAPELSWGANLGVAWPTEERVGEDSRTRLLSWSLSAGLDLGERLGGFLEYFGADPHGADDEHSLDGGLTYLAASRLQLDASAGLGLDAEAPDWFAGVGLALLLGL